MLSSLLPSLLSSSLHLFETSQIVLLILDIFDEHEFRLVVLLSDFAECFVQVVVLALVLAVDQNVHFVFHLLGIEVFWLLFVVGVICLAAILLLDINWI